MPYQQADSASGQTVQQQKERKLVQPERILTVPLESIRPSMPKDIHPITSIDLPETRQKKTTDILHAAYETVRIGGTLGTTYELSTKHLPNPPENFFNGKPLKADCDEMVLAIVAAAKAYGVDMKDISVLDFDITVKFSGGVTQMTMGHAVAITMNESTILFDPAFGFNGIHIKDKKPETLDEIYRGQKVLDGSYVVVGVDRAKEPVELAGDKEIASLHYHDLGAYYQIKGNSLKAAEAFETAYLLGKAEEDKKLMIEGFDSLYDQSTKDKSFQKAERYLRKMLQYSPSAQYLTDLGQNLSFQGRYVEAIAEFDRSISLNPKSGVLYAHKASALRQTGQTAKAIEVLETAISTGVGSIDIYKELTFLYNNTLVKTNLKRSITVCGEWEKLVPFDAEMFVKQSYAYLELARFAAEEAKTSGDYRAVFNLLTLSKESAKLGLEHAIEGSDSYNALISTRRSALKALDALQSR